MHAFTLSTIDRTLTLRASDIAWPTPSADEVLIAVKAAGVTPTELVWYPTSHRKDGSPRYDAVPGHEFSGTVAEVGPNVTHLKAGDDVFGMSDWFADGATADFCLAAASSVLLKPAALLHQVAAAIPISALTAWQGLVERAKARPGERVLILGAAGAVGLMAVQIAIMLRCHVVATASSEHFETLRALGVEELFDYHTTRFADVAGPVDIVFDTVGGDSLQLARPLLRDGGRVITIAAEQEDNRDPLATQAFFIVEPSAEQLASIASAIDKEQIRVFVKATIPFASAPAAYLEPQRWGRDPGKLVLVHD